MILLLNAIALNIYRADNFRHPVAGIVVVAGMTAWTAFTVWAYADPDRRTAHTGLAAVKGPVPIDSYPHRLHTHLQTDGPRPVHYPRRGAYRSLRSRP